MPDLSSLPSWLLAIFTLLLGVGGFFALRHGSAKQAAEVEDRVIKALQVEIESLRRKVDDLEKDNSRLSQALDTIRRGLRQRGLKITIEGDMVTFEDASSGKSNIIRIQDKLPAKQSRPITPAPDDDETAN
jgi:hypothetical protein